MQCIFLHGLDSSGNGTKGRFFARHFPAVLRPDFSGDLAARLAYLETIAAGEAPLLLVGSSYGGLMATFFALTHPARIYRLVLLAPALNFPEFSRRPPGRIAADTRLYIGRDDTVTPPAQVVPAARELFAELRVEEVADDHLLHATFTRLDWQALLV